MTGPRKPRSRSGTPTRTNAVRATQMRTFTLPAEALAVLDALPAGSRSAFVARAILAAAEKSTRENTLSVARYVPRMYYYDHDDATRGWGQTRCACRVSTEGGRHDHFWCHFWCGPLHQDRRA